MKRGFDAIIVLGAGVTKKGNLTRIARSRMGKAVELYQKGVAPRIVVSGKREALAMRKYAVRKEIPGRCVFAENHSLDTIGNAFFTRKLFLEPGVWNRVVVVTSVFHVARAGFIFRKVLGKGYYVKVVPSMRVVSDKALRLKLRSEMGISLLTRLLSVFVADGDSKCIENFIRKNPVYQLYNSRA